MKKSIRGNNLIVFPEKPHGRVLGWNLSILQNNWNIKNKRSVYGGFKIVCTTTNKHTIQNKIHDQYKELYTSKISK